MLLQRQLDACIGFSVIGPSYCSLQQQAVLLQLLVRFQESADSDASSAVARCLYRLRSNWSLAQQPAATSCLAAAARGIPGIS